MLWACQSQFPSCPVTEAGLSVIIYSLLVEKVPDSRTQNLKVSNWPGKVIGLLGTFTDMSAKITDCTVCFPTQSVCHQIHSG